MQLVTATSTTRSTMNAALGMFMISSARWYEPTTANCGSFHGTTEMITKIDRM
ncbi:hypothetical protein D3C81_2006990 [compost metagenome]